MQTAHDDAQRKGTNVQLLSASGGPRLRAAQRHAGLGWCRGCSGVPCSAGLVPWPRAGASRPVIRTATPSSMAVYGERATVPHKHTLSGSGGPPNGGARPRSLSVVWSSISQRCASTKLGYAGLGPRRCARTRVGKFVCRSAGDAAPLSAAPGRKWDKPCADQHAPGKSAAVQCCRSRRNNLPSKRDQR